jgi:predicted nucleic acid-binding protein
MDEENKEVLPMEKLIEELRSRGLKDEEIIPALERLAQEGKLSPEELEEAKKLLDKEEEQEAEKLFGLKFVK